MQPISDALELEAAMRGGARLRLTEGGQWRLSDGREVQVTDVLSLNYGVTGKPTRVARERYLSGSIWPAGNGDWAFVPGIPCPLYQ